MWNIIRRTIVARHSDTHDTTLLRRLGTDDILHVFGPLSGIRIDGFFNSFSHILLIHIAHIRIIELPFKLAHEHILLKHGHRIHETEVASFRSVVRNRLVNEHRNEAFVTALANKVDGKALYKFVAVVHTELHCFNKVVVVLL